MLEISILIYKFINTHVIPDVMTEDVFMDLLHYSSGVSCIS